jgi:uncharacterized protein DUF4386
MKSPVAAGRTIGVLLLLQLAAGLMAPYMMLRPLGDLFTYNANDPAKSFQVRLSVMLLFLGAVIVLAISFTAGPALRERGRVIGLWVIALAVVNFSLQCVENAAWMSMFNFSQEYAKAAGTNLATYQIVGASVRSYWKWVHYTHLLFMVIWMFVLFLAFWRAALIPSVLAAFGMLATLMQITGITLPQFIPYPTPSMNVTGLPLAFAYVAIAGWLIVKGFREARN